MGRSYEGGSPCWAYSDATVSARLGYARAAISRCGKAEAGIGEQDVKAPVPALDFLEHAIDLMGRPQVGAQRQYPASDVACRSIQAPLIGARDDDLRTLRDKQLRGFKPDPRRAAGDEGNLV